MAVSTSIRLGRDRRQPHDLGDRSPPRISATKCEAACPKEISVQFIAQLNREYLAACLDGSET